MRNTLVAVAITVAMLNVFAPAVSAYGGCASPGFPTISPTWHVLRNVAGRQYNYAQGTTTLRNLHSCDPSNGFDQFSGVMGANLEEPTCFMQIGYGAVGGTMYY